MSDRTWLRQVTLSRRVHEASCPGSKHPQIELICACIRRKEDVFWIKEGFAVVGKRVVDEDGIVWRVSEVHGRSAVDDLDKRYAAWRRWRDVLE